MAHSAADIDYYGDDIYFGDTGLYHNDLLQNPTSYYAFQEIQCHRLSVRVDHADAYPFTIHDIRPRLSRIRQGSFTHEAFIDRVTPSEHMSVRVEHMDGSDFRIDHIQLIAHRKRKQPIG